MYKRGTAFLLMICIILGLAGCGNKRSDTVQVVLDWTPNTNHTGLYVALDKGYYEEAGVKVEIIQPPEDGALALVGAGKAQFGVGFQESLGSALAATKPLPIVAVAAIVNHNTSGLVFLAKSGIHSPKDFKGKQFASWGTPFVDAIMREIVEKDGGDYSKVNVVNNTVTDVISALQADIDIVWVYEGWDGIALKQSKLDYYYLAFKDLDPRFDFYTPILVANTAYLENQPDQAKRFMSATAKGYEYAIENPEKAAEILLKYAPELSRDLVMESQKYLSAQYKADGAKWGEIRPERWSTFYQWMYEKGLLEQNISHQGYTGEFLP